MDYVFFMSGFGRFGDWRAVGRALRRGMAPRSMRSAKVGPYESMTMARSSMPKIAAVWGVQRGEFARFTVPMPPSPSLPVMR